MNYFNLSTVYMAILTCNLLIAAIAVMIRREKIMINVGYKLITVFLFLTALRFLLPIEVSYATTIPLPQGISAVIIQVFHPLFSIGDYEIWPLHFLLLIWLAGILVQSIRYYLTNRRILAFIFTQGKNVTQESPYAELLTGIGASTYHKFQIYELSPICTPILYGFRKPYILIPADYIHENGLVQQNGIRELSYILKHEVMHYEHHDLLIKFGVRLLSILYWWNPFCHLLNEQMDLVLEMRIDDSVTSLNDRELSEYLHTLLHLAEYQNTILDHPMGNTISFARVRSSILTKRFQMLLHRRQKKNRGLNLLLILLVGAIYLCSYLFIFEAYYTQIEESGEVYHSTDSNSFLIDNGDGTYDSYFNNIRIEVVDSLEHFSKDIPIYTREEFEHVQQNAPE